MSLCLNEPFQLMLTSLAELVSVWQQELVLEQASLLLELVEAHLGLEKELERIQ